MKIKSAMKIAVIIVLAMTEAAFAGCVGKGEPDKLGSWGQINQTLTRPEGWKQIVTNSKFQLGERYINGFWYEDDETVYYYGMKFDTYPSIDGSTVAVPMAVEFARQHLGFKDEDANTFAAFNTTHYAYLNLIHKLPNTMGMINSENIFMDDTHPVDIIIATEPSADEVQIAKDFNVTLVKKPVCCDAFVFITNKNNPVDSLTIKQVQDIYSGKITNWKEVGGPDLKIAAYQREENSGSQTAMLNLVMKGVPMADPAKVKITEGMGSLIEVVAEFKNDKASIGYTYKYYIDTLYKNDNIKVLKINGTAADEDNIRSGAYPFSTYYYGVIRKGDENKTGGKFLDWMLSVEGQKCIKQAGYIPYIKVY